MNNHPPSNLETISFEAALARLESILEHLNSGTVSLEESVKLYEEATHLSIVCSKRLNEAERRIEILTKNRNGELVLSEDTPVTQDYKVLAAH